jgi:hypothetical protein
MEKAFKQVSETCLNAPFVPRLRQTREAHALNQAVVKIGMVYSI